MSRKIINIVTENEHEYFPEDTHMEFANVIQSAPTNPDKNYYENNNMRDGVVVNADRIYMNYNGVDIRVQILPEHVQLYRGFSAELSHKGILQSYPQYFGSLDVAKHYGMNGSYVCVKPNKELKLLDFGHPPSVLKLIHVLEKRKSANIQNADFANLIQKWIDSIRYATGIGINKQNVKNEESQMQKIADDHGYFWYEEGSGVTWIEKSDTKVFEMQQYPLNKKKHYILGSLENAILRLSFTDADYIICEAIKYAFPTIDGYSAGFLPIRSVTGGNYFSPEICIFYPSILLHLCKQMNNTRARQNGGYSISPNTQRQQQQQLQLQLPKKDDTLSNDTHFAQKLNTTQAEYFGYMKKMLIMKTDEYEDDEDDLR